jgi:DNA topoisomerase IB
MEEAAGRLGNTPAVARQSYVDVRLVEAWQDGDLARIRVRGAAASSLMDPPTRAEEEAILRLLRHP